MMAMFQFVGGGLGVMPDPGSGKDDHNSNSFNVE